jgi:hypothetical protein
MRNLLQLLRFGSQSTKDGRLTVKKARLLVVGSAIAAGWLLVDPGSGAGARADGDGIGAAGPRVHGSPQIITTSLPAAFLGQAYQAGVLASGGFAPLEFFIVPPAPPGIAILASGELHGTALVAGFFQITVGVFDATDHYAFRTLPLVVQPQFPGKVSVELETDRESYHIFDTVGLSRRVGNSGPPRLADFYLGLITPSGRTVMFFSLNPLLCREVDPDDPTTFFPLQTNVTLPSEIQLAPQQLLAEHLPLPLEAGIYYWVAAYTDPGSTRVISNIAVRGASFF